ncbi:Serine-threonine/tyrosine-protein kinase, catalytic domain [Sesbania bispinosa]|nr:Serine-threonine/tyrosine-protein kinase, catalytic domain [Sesbania bispinosa]
MDNQLESESHVHYNHTDPCKYARWTARESFQFMYARPWERVNDFYLNVVNGNLSLPLLFGAETVLDYNDTEFQALSDKTELESVASEDRSGRWARNTFKIVLSYHGSSFDGWQKQPGLKTVQRQVALLTTSVFIVEGSLGKFVDEKKAQLLKDKGLPIEGCAVVAGRTDKGVTGLQQCRQGKPAFAKIRREIAVLQDVARDTKASRNEWFECLWQRQFREAAAGAEDDALIKLMDATCRRATAPPAPPDGLCLVDVGVSRSLKSRHAKGDHNNWRGVLCNQGKVWGLKLENMGLKGFIDVDSLKELPYLRTISFMNNDLEGNEDLCGDPLVSCHSKKPSIVSIIVVAVVVGLAVIVIAAVIIIILHRRKQGASSSVEDPPSLTKGRVRESGDESHRSSRSMSSNHSRRGDHMKLSFIRDDRERFDLQELLRASAEILGSGCFSSSYKASLMNGPTIVVKRFKQMNNVGKEEFQEHMRRIGRLSSPNLLPLVAYYYRKEEKLLVTDYVQNGSLAVRLHGHQALGEPSLDWPIRLKIVKGIAKGLEYLYKDMPSLIAPHGNLKSSNVLLTQSFEPLLTDYGLVPVTNQDMAQDIMVIYKSPEYLQHGRITKKSDVWCLGTLILEILTGKFPATFMQQGKGSEVSLSNWVHSIVPEEWTSAVFDKDMGATKNSEGEIVKLLKIALSCCEGDVEKRSDLKEVVEKIQEVKERDNDEEFYTSYASEADMKP